MEPSDSMEEGSAIYRCGNGTGFLIYQTENAGTAKNTQMGWETDNLEREMEELRGRGVVFEEYDFPGLKTENGVATSDWGRLPGSWTARATFSTSPSARRPDAGTRRSANQRWAPRLRPLRRGPARCCG
jgi:hypothetical protein